MRKARAVFWDFLAHAAWRMGRIIDGGGTLLAGPLYGLSGNFDARADSAGWWEWHLAPSEYEAFTSASTRKDGPA